MATIIRLKDHARASAGAGYKSGRNSCRGTPVTRSTAKTRKGGTSSHCETACSVIPSGPASPANPPTKLIARCSGSVLSVMAEDSSIALPQSQALLHCVDKVLLYTVEMSLGKRIKSARERLRPKPTQADVAARFGVTDKAVSAWERDDTVPDLDKIAKLAKVLKVPCIWLLEGAGAPPAPDAIEVTIEGLRPSERALVAAMIETIQSKRDSAA